MHLYSINDVLFESVYIASVDDADDVAFVALKGSYCRPKHTLASTTCIAWII